MKCSEMLALLNDYVDGDVAPEICREFEKHMAGCDPCRVVIDNIRKTITLYKGEEVFELPAGFREKLHGLLQVRFEQLHGKPPA